MIQKYCTTRRLEAFTWDALVMHTASLNCYCSKKEMSCMCLMLGLGVCDNIRNGRKTRSTEKLFNNSNTLILLVVSVGILTMVLII